MSENVLNREFLGQGLAFPLQLTPRGGIALAVGERDIEQSIRIILGTMPGERVMRPEFGCYIHDLVFAPHDAATEGLAIHYIKRALDRWEPRITLRSVDIAPSVQDGTMLIEIKYQTKDTHDERSIVYPFYITDEEI
ncbi:MAG: GPW/gp25 family protein [Anaerolineae bacterium]|nr:GPW/gp25 family protein [Anaerolineae bacterium]